MQQVALPSLYAPRKGSVHTHPFPLVRPQPRQIKEKVEMKGFLVIPAKAGIHLPVSTWIPAFAGMTDFS